MATSFILSLSEAKAKCGYLLDEVLPKNLPDPNSFFADKIWAASKPISRQWIIKTKKDNVNAIKKHWKSGEGNIVLKEFPDYFTLQTDEGYKIKFEVSDKTSKGGADAKTTRLQELCSALVIRKALVDGKKYATLKQMYDDGDLKKELIEIYPDALSDGWLETFFLQHKKMLSQFSAASFSEVDRESPNGFMNYITEKVKKYGISKKDVWNPADIWIIKDESSVRKIIEDQTTGVTGSRDSQTIQELNVVMRKLFKEKKLIGISLKKISGKQAQYEEVNVDKTDLGKSYNYKTESPMINLSWDSKENTFGTQDSKISAKGDGSTYDFQIKGNDTKSFSNLKWEATSTGARAARVGKAPVDYVKILMNDIGMNYVNDHNKFPKTVEQFKSKKSTYKSMFNKIKGKVTTKCANVDEFESNMISGFAHTPFIAVSKLMQLNFISELYSKPQKDIDDFMTDMVFLASKRGERFGPHGKLY